MGLFKALVNTVVNVAIGLPVAAVQDVFTMGGAADGNGRPHLVDAIQTIKDEADGE